MAGKEGFEPSHAGIKIQCLNQLGDFPKQSYYIKLTFACQAFITLYELNLTLFNIQKIILLQKMNVIYLNVIDAVVSLNLLLQFDEYAHA